MNGDARCPRCGQSANEGPACRHLRWRPQRGGPIEFIQSVIRDRAGPELASAEIPSGWWESQYDWLLERIMARIDVVDGHCFAEPGDLDRLRLDVKHRLEPERACEPLRTMP